MPSNPVSSLSSNGWITDPFKKADVLLARFLNVNQPSQSNIYTGNIHSLPGIIQKWGNNSLRLQQETQQELEDYFNGYFEAVSATVHVIDPTSTTDARTTLQVNVMLTDRGQTYSLGRMVSFLNSKTIEVINLNNGG